jgi:hypothetical protein
MIESVTSKIRSKTARSTTLKQGIVVGGTSAMLCGSNRHTTAIVNNGSLLSAKTILIIMM